MSTYVRTNTRASLLSASCHLDLKRTGDLSAHFVWLGRIATPGHPATKPSSRRRCAALDILVAVTVQALDWACRIPNLSPSIAAVVVTNKKA